MNKNRFKISTMKCSKHFFEQSNLPANFIFYRRTQNPCHQLDKEGRQVKSISWCELATRVMALNTVTKDLSDPHKKWLLLFLPLAWSGHVGLGLALGVFGPTQPYLAKNVGESVDTINLIWTGEEDIKKYTN